MINMHAGGVVGTVVALVLLVTVLAFAVVRPFGSPEAVGALPTAAAAPRGVHPAWVALAGAAVLAVPPLLAGGNRAATAGRMVAAANPAFCVFVLGLGVVVEAVGRGGFGRLVARVAPDGTGLAALFGMAVIGAVLANLLNNLPATLMLLPLTAHSPGLVLAVLLGVNIGPNLTHAGSLATLLWRRLLRVRGAAPVATKFVLLGALITPACLLVGVPALWLGLHMPGLHPAP